MEIAPGHAAFPARNLGWKIPVNRGNGVSVLSLPTVTFVLVTSAFKGKFCDDL